MGHRPFISGFVLIALIISTAYQKIIADTFHSLHAHYMSPRSHAASTPLLALSGKFPSLLEIIVASILHTITESGLYSAVLSDKRRCRSHMLTDLQLSHFSAAMRGMHAMSRLITRPPPLSFLFILQQHASARATIVLTISKWS